MQQYTFLTVANILDRARNEAIGSSTSQITALQDTQMIERIEQINEQFINAAHTRHHKGGWSWMEKSTVFQSVDNTDLDGAIAAGAATLALTDASNFDSSGKIVIETAKNSIDFVDYESKSSNTLTVSTTSGDDVVDIAHADAERVEKLYQLPSDYAKTRKLFVDFFEYFYERANLFPHPTRYSTVGNYIFLPRDIGSEDITHYYEKKAATLDETTDTTDIPTAFQRYPIEMLKAHIFTIRRKRNDISFALQQAEQALEEALDYDVQRTSTSASSPGIDTDY